MNCSSCYQPLALCNCNPCSTDDCTIQLDTKCVFYHKDNNSISLLLGLDLANGSTLQLILETLDEKIRQLNVLNTTLTNLRETYVINNLQSFLTSVDTEIGSIRDRLDILEP